MKNKFKKWSLWVCGIVSAICLGIGTGVSAVGSLQDSVILAQAEAHSYTVNSLTYLGGDDASKINAYPNDGLSKPNVGSWDHVYTLQEGLGVMLNGDVLRNCVVKFPNDFYIELNTSVNVGDVLIIDGTFYNAEKEMSFIFNNCGLKWNGTSWEQCAVVSFDNITANGTGNANTLYLQSEGNPLADDKQALTYVGGFGVRLNGEDANDRVESIIRENGGITFNAKMDDAIVDVIHLNGLYTDGTTYYAIEDCYFMWTGEFWRLLQGFDTIVSKLVPVNSGNFKDQAKGFYFPLDNPIGIEDWGATPRTYGHGLKLNGKELKNGTINFYNAYGYVSLGTNAQVGDVLTINGLYEHANGYKLLFAPTPALRWNGTSWERLGGISYDFDKMVLHEKSVSGAEAVANKLYLTREDGGWSPAQSCVDSHIRESGLGVCVNGNAINYTMTSGNDGLCLEFNSVNVGDVVTVGGTFICESQHDRYARYAMKEVYFEWTGSGWIVSVTYIKTQIDNASVGAANNVVGGFFLDLPSSVGFADWERTYSLTSGAGFTLNGVPTDGVVIKPINTQLYFDTNGLSAKEGDILTVEGTFICEVENTVSEIVFGNTKTFIWNGTQWVLDTYTTYNIGALTLHGNSASGVAKQDNAVLYLARKDGEALPVLSWEDVFVYENGFGFAVNNVQKTPNVIKSTGDGLYWSFDALSVSDEITIGGVFVCDTQHARYIIEESHFVWEGDAWEAAKYTKYNIESLQPTHPSTNEDAPNTQVYLKIEGNIGLPVQTWDYMFVLQSGAGLTVNGESRAIHEMKSAPEGLWLSFDAVNVFDEVAIDGVFVCKELNVSYTITNSVFMWEGEFWTIILNVEDLAFADTVTLLDFGWDLDENFAAFFNGTVDKSGTNYTPSAENETGSIKLRFGYNSANVTAGCIDIRLRGDAWTGYHFRILGGYIEFVDEGSPFRFENDKDYVIELGAINLADSANVYMYIKVDDVVLASKLTAANTFDSNHVSFYFGGVAETTLTDCDHIKLVDEMGETKNVEKGSEYTLAAATSSTFIGWFVNGELYSAGETIVIGNANTTITAYTIDFKLKDGAAIRLANTADESGIRFTPMINTNDWNALAGYGVTVKEFGTLIMPNDYLSEGQAPNLNDFVVGSTILKIMNTGADKEGYTEQVGGYVVYYGAMKKLYTQNYGRDFAGRGYMIIEVNGEERILYTPFTSENVRSVRYVAQQLQLDTSEYEALSDAKKAVVDTYANSPVYGQENVAATALNENYAAAYVVNEKKAFCKNVKDEKISFATQRKERV